MDENNKQEKNIWRAVWLLLRDVILPTLAGYILFFQIFGVNYVLGRSMEPTYGSGKILLINRLQRNDLQRWDIVVVETDNGDIEKKIIKRVIGLPGEAINITKDGEVSINGTVLNTSNRRATCKGIVRNTKSMQERRVPVLGKAKKRTVQTCLNAF